MFIMVPRKQMAMETIPVICGHPQLDRGIRHLFRSHSRTFSTFCTAV